MEIARFIGLFIDIGGVLLTNGWDRGARELACDVFGLDFAETDELHHETFGTYEEGKLNLDEYIDRVFFSRKRAFSREELKSFMYARSEPYPEMIKLVCDLKSKYKMKVVIISNEGRELTEYRIEKFGLRNFVDSFISSCFVGYRKPDKDIFRLALDTAQVPYPKALYIDDRLMFVNVARELGIQSIHHTSCDSTRKELETLGLSL